MSVGMIERLHRWLTGSEVHEVRGFHVTVVNTRPDIATTDTLHRLNEALELIERHVPASFRHMRRDAANILVVRYPTRGAYLPETRSILTELTFLARRDISAAVVASSIVHEATHARVDSMRRRLGSQATTHADGREERLCRRAELYFGQALPADLGAPVIERATALLAAKDEELAPEIDWNVAYARQAAIDAEARQRSQDRAE